MRELVPLKYQMWLTGAANSMCPMRSRRDVYKRQPHVLDGGALDHLAGVFDVGGDLEVDQPLHDEGLEELERHLLGQAALVHPQLRPDDDDRTARIVDALTEEVLAETALRCV